MRALSSQGTNILRGRALKSSEPSIHHHASVVQWQNIGFRNQRPRVQLPPGARKGNTAMLVTLDIAQGVNGAKGIVERWMSAIMKPESRGQCRLLTPLHQSL